MPASADLLDSAELGELASEFYGDVYSYAPLLCAVCQEAWPVRDAAAEETPYTCRRCHDELQQRQREERQRGASEAIMPPLFSDANHMHLDRCPPELAALSFLERQSIALYVPLEHVVRLRGGQYGYSGHVSVVDNSAGVRRLATVLPRRLEAAELPVLILRRSGSERWGGGDFRVRAGYVRRALDWLSGALSAVPQHHHR